MSTSLLTSPAASSTQGDPGHKITREERDDRTAALFAGLRERGDARCRDELVRLHLPLVRHLVRRFRGKGESSDDLEQVGAMALLKAIDRYDPGRGIKFSTFATPTILGELKRHFRDRMWSVRVPRGLQEMSLRVTRASRTLKHELGRSPSMGDIAEYLETDRDTVVEALEAAQAYTADSLEAGTGDEESFSIASRLGATDVGFERLEEMVSLAPAVAELPERERRILFLRFFEGRTQSEIGERVGISQMHVSRQLRRSVAFIRARQDDPSVVF